MKTPVVLPTVQINVDDDGVLTIDVDGDRYESDSPFTRSELPEVLDAITSDLDSAVRVEIRESDGTTYDDIAVPPEDPPEIPPSGCVPEPKRQPGVRGTGFRPGEQVAIAYVLLRETADQDGHADLRLPPSLLTDRTAGIVLMGLSSKVATLIEESA